MTRSGAFRGGPQIRDPERTRERILLAAFQEFAAKGLSGARVDQIARRAKINKRMLYHYFGNKRALFHAVLRWKIAERQAHARTFSDDSAKNLPNRFLANCRDADWVRLLKWESLQMAGNRIENEAERRAATRRAQAELERRQRTGLLNPKFDARHMSLAKLSLTMFPVAFPHLTSLITGRLPDDPKFQREYMDFLEEFAAAFAPAQAKK